MGGILKHKERMKKKYASIIHHNLRLSQWAFTCSKLAIETIEQGVRYVQSQQ